jgi:diguanylate cyclase (GGDEF)-like protein/PAS domain S-box-containing protein
MSEQTEILIIDDDRLHQAYLERILRPLCLSVLAVSSGEEALGLIPTRDLALVIMDVSMPGIDGFTTAERIRGFEASRQLPIIFVTGVSTDDSCIFRGYELGAVDYLIKPVEPQVLTRKVRVFVELHKKQRALEETTRKLERTIARLKRSREALTKSEERYRIIADYNYDLETWIGPDEQMLYVSLSCERITGYPPEKFMEDPHFMDQIIHKDDLTLWKQNMEYETIQDDQTFDFRIFRKDGRMRWLSQVNRKVFGYKGEPLGVRCSMSDITHRKQMEIQLRHQALHDPLTGLANRTFCLERVRQALERIKRRENYYFALVFIDLDRFKVINDSFGHSFGDKLLIEVGERLVRCVRGLDTVSRFGGDEFVILLEELVLPREAIRIVNRMREALHEPFYIDSQEMLITASFGIVLKPSEVKNADALLQNANIAMYRAKKVGRDRLKVFNTKMLEQAVQLMALETDLRRAIANREFFLVYQPIYTMSEGRLAGFEALVRWQHPERGLIGPGEFIPVAEETGFIVELGLWVLEEACRTLSGWLAFEGQNGLTMSVNISARQFSQSDLVDQVKRILTTTGVPSRAVKLEITETTIMENADSAVDKLNRLKALGVGLSVDDFGTGYSSISYLYRFPLDTLKIDLSFVKMIDVAPENREIVKGIINLAHSLKLNVVAEGVERPVHREILASLDCDYAQGFLFSRPIGECDVPALFGLPAGA